MISMMKERNRKYKSLKDLPDSTLTDIGYSPELMKMGKKAYPWKHVS